MFCVCFLICKTLWSTLAKLTKEAMYFFNLHYAEVSSQEPGSKFTKKKISKFLRFFVTSSYVYEEYCDRALIYDYCNNSHTLSLMPSTLKWFNNQHSRHFKILRIWLKKFCEFLTRFIFPVIWIVRILLGQQANGNLYCRSCHNVSGGSSSIQCRGERKK